MELLFRDRRQDAALEADHRADERVDQHQQRELTQVLTQAEARCGRVHRSSGQLAEVVAHDGLHVGRRRRDVGHEGFDEGIALHRQHWVEAALEARPMPAFRAAGV